MVGRTWGFSKNTDTKWSWDGHVRASCFVDSQELRTFRSVFKLCPDYSGWWKWEENRSENTIRINLYENHILELRNAELNVKDTIASSGNDIRQTENVSPVFALKTHIHLSFWELHLKVNWSRLPCLPVLATRQYWSTEWTQEYPLITHCSIVRLTWLSVAEIRNNTFSIFGFDNWLFNWLLVAATSI